MERYLQSGLHTFSVLGYIDETDNFIDNKAYVDKNSGKVYVYVSEPPSRSMLTDRVPRFYKNGETLEFKEPPGGNPDYVFDKTYSCTLDDIRKETVEGEQLYNREQIDDLNNAASFYVPTINDDDDFLKKTIKMTILEKGINVKSLQHRFEKKYAFSNILSALNGKTKMSVLNFIAWADLLDIKFDIYVKDIGPNPTPLGDRMVHYDSTTNQAESEVIDDDDDYE